MDQDSNTDQRYEVLPSIEQDFFQIQGSRNILKGIDGSVSPLLCG
jgi:hypothetical protein